MAEAEEKGETNHVSLQMNIFSRDLLQRFISGDHFPRNFEERKHEEEEEDVELSLGLSLNGRFGVDPKRAKKLIRSSSTSNFTMTDDNNTARVTPVAYSPLVRTCSLPTETQEELRKRKELQSLRRMEAKRKRLEKLKNVRTLRDQEKLEGNGEDNVRAQIQRSVSPFGGAVTDPGIESKGERANGPQPSSQGSIGSQGTGSSGISEIETQPIQGMNKNNEARSPVSVQSLPEQKPVLTPGTTEKSGKLARAVVENPSTKGTITDKGANKMARNVMLDMPCVSTGGDGPNGKRISGFLYRYGKGEEVRIVCVCHGSFLSPAEFVKHAGGGDVAYPLKHIVVNPSSLL
uniref:Ninja-family protein n=1 Tax=Davidia involucrata TaxID=16924 RepID=A0A5B6ZFD8_DAVIN